MLKGVQSRRFEGEATLVPSVNIEAAYPLLTDFNDTEQAFSPTFCCKQSLKHQLKTSGEQRP